MLDRLLHHAVVVVTEGESYRMREAKTTRRPPLNQDLNTHTRGGDFRMATSGDFKMAVDTYPISPEAYERQANALEPTR